MPRAQQSDENPACEHERCQAHDAKQHAKRTVGASAYALRRHVPRRAEPAGAFGAPVRQLARHPEVADFDLAARVEQQVGGLEVAVDDVQLLVQEAQPKQHTRRNDARMRLRQRAVRRQQLRQRAAVHVLQHDCDAAFGQERGVQRHDGGAVQRGVQAAQLADDALAHLFAHVQRYDLERKQRARGQVQRAVHDAGGAAADHARDAQVAQRHVERALGTGRRVSARGRRARGDARQRWSSVPARRARAGRLRHRRASCYASDRCGA